MEIKKIVFSIALTLAGFLSATAQNYFTVQERLQKHSAFEYPDFEKPKFPVMKKARSGQDWWVPDTVYRFVNRTESYDVYRNIFKYNHDSQGLLVVVESSQWQNINSWVSYGGQTIYTYDSNHNLLTERRQSRSNGLWVNFSQFATTYDSNHNILTERHQIWRNNSWVNGDYYYQFTYTYDDSNRNMLTKLQQSWSNDSWVNLNQITYTYDSNNNMLTELRRNWSNDSWVNRSQITYTYDSNNNIQTKLLKIWMENNSLGNYSLITTTYDSKHNLLTELQQRWGNNSWINDRQYLMAYDENGNSTSAESWNWINESWQPWGNGIFSDITIWLYYNNMQSTFGGLSCDKMTASYKKVNGDYTNVEPIATSESETISIYPNPTTGEFQIRNSGFEIQDIRIFNLSGAYVFNSRQTTLDVSHLPAGMYFVQLTTEKGIVTKKLVKICR
jgi:hypothetical protein